MENGKDEMREVGLYIGTTLRGSAKGPGRVMFLLKTKRKTGQDYESTPEVGEFADTTERRLVLLGILEALKRLNYACTVTVHTECDYIQSVLSQSWLDKWQQSGWQNSRGKPVKDADLWKQLLKELEESGHILTAVAEKHEYSDWMRWKMSLTGAYKDTFSKVQKSDCD